MVPWPIAFLSLFYAVVATLSASAAWKIVSGMSDRPMLWPLAWLALAFSTACGLALLKPWGRALAVVGSVVMALVTLALAGLLVMGGHPVAALLATLASSVYAVVIRYLGRPVVREYFHRGISESVSETSSHTYHSSTH